MPETVAAMEAFYLPESPVPIPEDASVVVDAIDTVIGQAAPGADRATGARRCR